MWDNSSFPGPGPNEQPIERSQLAHQDFLYTEPLEAWRRYLNQAVGILRVAAKLLSDKPGREEDWAAIDAGEPRNKDPFVQADSYPLGAGRADARGDLGHEQWLLDTALRRWQQYGRTRMHPYSHPPGSGNLASRLSADLTVAILGNGGVYECAGCGKPFTSQGRRRAANRNKWCGDPECKRERNRRNVKRHYEKTKKKGGN